MHWTKEEVVRSYREAADPKKQIGIIAELNAVPKKEIRGILEEAGMLKPEAKKPTKPEPRFTMEPRKAVTVDELCKLLEQAAADGYGECAVTVEGQSFTGLWLETRGTIRVSGDGERGIELKGSTGRE